MAEYIEREHLRDNFIKYLNSPHVRGGYSIGQGMRVAIKSCIAMVDEEPAFDTVPARQHARWRRTGRIFNDLIEVQCPECEETHLFDATRLETAARYCPYCGVEMDEGADNEIN